MRLFQAKKSAHYTRVNTVPTWSCVLSYFPPSIKTTTSKFQLDMETVGEELLCGYATTNPHKLIIITLLFLYFIFNFIFRFIQYFSVGNESAVNRM